MILLPEKFDTNEWFVLATIAVNAVIILLLPKRLPTSVALLIMLFSVASAKTLDHILGTPPTDSFDVNDSPKYEIFDLLMYFLYTPFGYYLIYFYDRWKPKGFAVWLYIVLWSMFATGFEWVSVLTRVYKYNTWKLLYSLPVYLITITLTILYYHLLMRRYIESRRNRGFDYDIDRRSSRIR
ncbi:hypothetical protein [Paenibacillus alkalitolerans]|uniref:hypothetical protein n=1 Tax=Paenibacillus alkalitolerans TaxID=2799335 RepID=UPI0018F4F65D|nr:hypothetical protein [Paenibacillus alkalitolerans]